MYIGTLKKYNNNNNNNNKTNKTKKSVKAPLNKLEYVSMIHARTCK